MIAFGHESKQLRESIYNLDNAFMHSAYRSICHVMCQGYRVSDAGLLYSDPSKKSVTSTGEAGGWSSEGLKMEVTPGLA